MNVGVRSVAFAAVVIVALAGLMTACVGYDPRYPPPTASPPAASEPSASSGTKLHVALEQATNNLVTIDVTDESGTLLSAESGTPGDGASVEADTLEVGNDGPSTVRLTWVGGPCDSANALAIDSSRRQFLLVQPECSGDSIVTDRILVLEFAQPIDASDVQAVIQDGLDTPG